LGQRALLVTTSAVSDGAQFKSEMRLLFEGWWRTSSAAYPSSEGVLGGFKFGCSADLSFAVHFVLLADLPSPATTRNPALRTLTGVLGLVTLKVV